MSIGAHHTHAHTDGTHSCSTLAYKTLPIITYGDGDTNEIWIVKSVTYPTTYCFVHLVEWLKRADTRTHSNERTSQRIYDLIYKYLYRCRHVVRGDSHLPILYLEYLYIVFFWLHSTTQNTLCMHTKWIRCVDLEYNDNLIENSNLIDDSSQSTLNIQYIQKKWKEEKNYFFFCSFVRSLIIYFFAH